MLKGSFFKNVAVLMSGTAIAQALAFAVSPLLSRIYTPEAFGVFGLFIAFCGIVTVIASGKYELAILLPKKDNDAANILLLSIFLVFVTVVFSLIIIILFREQIAVVFGSQELAKLLWLAPISILGGGLYNAFNYWTTRRKKFKRLSISRVIQSSSREGSQLLLGLMSTLQSGGLAVGHIVGQLGSSGALIYQTFREDYLLIRNSFSKNQIKKLAKQNKDFPKFNAPQNLVNSISKQAPALVLAYFFNPMIVGLYWFTYRILSAPQNLVGNSIRQVYYQKANEYYNNGINLKSLHLKTTLSLLLVGIIPTILIFFQGEVIFKIIFGENWIRAGKYAEWLIIPWLFQFINPPSIMLYPIFKKQNVLLNIEIISTVLKLSSIFIGGYYDNDMIAIILYSIVTSITYLIMIQYSYIKILKKS